MRAANTRDFLQFVMSTLSAYFLCSGLADGQVATPASSRFLAHARHSRPFNVEGSLGCGNFRNCRDCFVPIVFAYWPRPGSLLPNRTNALTVRRASSFGIVRPVSVGR